MRINVSRVIIVLLTIITIGSMVTKDHRTWNNGICGKCHTVWSVTDKEECMSGDKYTYTCKNGHTVTLSGYHR